MRAVFRLRVRMVLVVVLGIALLIVGRLYFVQIAHGARYSEKAQQQFSAAGQSGLFDRGSIYFTNKDGTTISAATLSTGYLVAINPRLVENAQTAYTAVSAVASTSLSKSAFLTAAANKNLLYVEVAHELSTAQGTALAAQNIPGVSVLQERWRSYPGGSLAAQSIGVLGYGSGNVLAGQTGLEAQYNSVLDRSGGDVLGNFFATLFSGSGSTLVSAQDAREGDLVTTIEPQVETRLERDLAEINKKFSSSGTGGIIMVPSTGAIIALGSVPTFDPNDLSHINPQILRNPLVENVYEFGSIMKPLTMASALDAGVITPQSTYDDTGCITVNAARICNWNFQAHGTTPMVTVIEQSLNVGASWVATQLGQQGFRKYFTSYFGQPSGVDLLYDQSALLNNLQTTEQVNFDDMSFGQGISVTPMQMIRALSAIANNGVMVQPHLGNAVVLNSGAVKPIDWSKSTRVFSAQTAHEVTLMLETVYPNDAKLTLDSDPNLQYANVPVAAKTGTAQVEKPGGGYYTNVFFHSFFGFFPANNPQFAILLYTNRPQGVEYASETLTGAFMDLVTFLSNYYNIPPDPQDVIPLPAKVVG